MRMYEIVSKQKLAPKVTRYDVYVPHIAKKRKPGQFVIISVNPDGERIPLTIADSDNEKGTITLIVQTVGKTTLEMTTKKVGDTLAAVVGPLGKPTDIEKYGNVVAVGGGVGIAPLYPITKGMKEAGNHITTILGARTRELMILEDEMRAISDEFIPMTDDGSYGGKGFVTDALKKLINDGKKIDLVVAIGPAIMMKFVSLLTKEYNIKTIVSLNTIMVDGTGMCGGCRVYIGGKIKHVCVDGPEFDGHLVDFDNMIKRLNSYKDHECVALNKFLKEHPELKEEVL